jgi:PAS domain S-box-containing protein
MVATSSGTAAGMPGSIAPARQGLALRWRLMLLVVAAVVPLLLFNLGFQYSEYREDIAATGERTTTLARNMVTLVEDELTARISSLETLASTGALQRGDLDTVRARAATVITEQFPGSNILLLSTGGQELLNTLRPVDAVLPVRSDLESLHRVLETGKPAVSDLFFGAASHRPVVAIDAPVKDHQGKIIYVLSMNPQLDLFSETIRRQHLPTNWLFAVFDRHGLTVARFPNGEQFVGQAASSNLLPLLKGVGDGHIENMSREGIALVTGYSHGELFGWAVAIGVPRAELTGPIIGGVTRTLGIGSTLLVIGLVLALYAARRIARPIDSLRLLAAAADDGTLVEPTPTGLPEVDDVAQALYTAGKERLASRKAELVLLDAIDTMPEGFVIYDDQTRLVMCNQSYRNFYPENEADLAPGVTFKEILRAGIRRGRFPDAAGREEEWLAERLSRQRDPQEPLEQRLADGRWVFVTKHRLANDWVVGLRVDITALKQAEQALQTSEERFRRVVEAVPNAIVMIGASGIIELVNAQAETIFGYPRADLLSQRIEMLLPERYRSRHPALREGVFATLQARLMGVGRELFALRQDGEEFPVEVGLSPIETEGGPSVLASIVDITARHQAARTQAYHAAIVESSADAIIAKDLDGVVTSWNKAAELIFGYTASEMVGEPITRLLPADRLDEENVILKKIRRGERIDHFETVRRRKDGTELPVSLTISPILGADAGVIGASKIARDITEPRRTEAQLRQAQKMEAIGNLTGGMAHDFNNVLGVIVGNLDLARERLGDSEDLREMVGEALEAAWRGADLTRRLLAFARRQPLRPAHIAVNDLVNDTVRLLRRLLGEDVEVTLNLGGDLWPVTADPAQLESSLANLANNARDAMPRGGRLIITTANRQLDADYAAEHADVTPGDCVMIEVSDTGTGMSPETMNQIFEPFFTTKEAGKGTGLGLSMVFGFLKQSGGHINVYSELGQGTTFRLYLPRATDEAAPEIAVPAAAPQGAGEIVLVVEDNPAMRRIATRQLRELGYYVLECDRAAAALDILQRERVDLLFTDIVMPGGLDGVELAHLARERWPSLKIVLTSGFPQARVDGNGELLANLRLLSKPYHKEELAAALRAALDG